MMKKYIYLLILFLMLSCSTTKKTTAEKQEQTTQASEVSNSQEQKEETTIMWKFPNDTTFLQNSSFFLTPLSDCEQAEKNKTMPSWGYINITKKASNNEVKKENTISQEQEKKKGQIKTVKETTVNWFLSAVLAFLIVFLCQCVINRKKIAQIFASLKK